MSDHATTAVAEPHDHAAPSAGEMRFEKSELEFFVEDDRATGSKIGKLLAVIFFVLVALMTGVALWTNRHQSVGDDPFSLPHAPAAMPGGH